ncbi:hypothetical protein [Arthrobacter rhizosphaerae]|uniref:hypothetical protein n=1 Tax=Arthrobacter rhizosphaerae TaxID=2855490 RepID=UPI001FF25108|nr:hypothetical protein [Arthrobacter rhizosphaerae]
MKRRWLSVTVLIFVLLATGCEGPVPFQTDTDPPEVSGSPPTQAPTSPRTTAAQTPAPAATILRPGKYRFNAATGATGTMEIPAPPVPGIEELRTFVNEAPVTYLTAVVDNRQGSVAINMDSISIFTPEGAEYKYQSASDYINKLREAVPAEAPAEIRSRFDELFKAHLGDAPPLAAKDFVLVGPAVPNEMSEIIVHPTSGFHPVPAVPANN